MRRPFCLLTLISLLSTCNASPLTKKADGSKKFDRYKLYRVVPTTLQQLDFVHSLERSFNRDNIDGNYQVNVWSEDISLGKNISIMIAPDQERVVLDALQKLHLNAKLIWNNVQELIDRQTPGGSFDRTHPFNRTMTWDVYHRFPTIEFFLRNLPESYPELVQLENIGLSYEGRVMWMLKLGKTRVDKKAKPAIWMDSGIHAREWISVATVTFMTNELLKMYQSDPDNRWLLDELDWYIVPVVNPDGYEHSHLSDRVWRKTRRLDPFTNCIGVDANRNYDFQWQTEKPQMNGCENLYGGATAFSEPENNAVSEKVLQLKNSLKVFMTFHSYGQLWMTPWGYTHANPENYDDMYSLAINATTRLKSLYGTIYKVGSSAAILYTSSGTSRDFAKGRTPIKYVYTIELRDDGEYEFLLPPDQILPTALETLEGVKVVAAKIVEEFT